MLVLVAKEGACSEGAFSHDAEQRLGPRVGLRGLLLLLLALGLGGLDLGLGLLLL